MTQTSADYRRRSETPTARLSIDHNYDPRVLFGILKETLWLWLRAGNCHTARQSQWLREQSTTVNPLKPQCPASTTNLPIVPINYSKQDWLVCGQDRY
ncbi:hypothetical protein RSOLAG1IB_05313 [Rhizoctonia solani AG-1 IB]|uniref:Uncharacterized protein n=1 Tax=Thanatephorus cucumeris (strain AG1-IB / isolate 7/3/14) TaxID=1108050 RepID=A0A0B7FZZ3_THACB|nr:hypothetical protein RSOLAG1IB_05313 [Rhizoctonia solani AG-1 IB]